MTTRAAIKVMRLQRAPRGWTYRARVGAATVEGLAPTWIEAFTEGTRKLEAALQREQAREWGRRIGAMLRAAGEVES